MLSAVRRFCSNRDGGIAILFALALPLLLVMAGMAIDYSRASMYKSQMQGAVDAAALSAATALRNGVDEQTVSELAIAMVEKNRGSINGTTGKPEIVISSSGDTRSVKIKSSGRSRTMFSGLLNVGDLDVSVAAGAVAQIDPAVNVAAGNLGGGTVLWGDPHFGTYENHSMHTITCASAKWYSIISDGGFQWNAMCQDDSTTHKRWADGIYTAHKVFAGSHVITYEALPITLANEALDVSHPEDLLPTMQSVDLFAWGAKITIDGVAYDPTSDVASGKYSRDLVDDSTEGVKVTVYNSHMALAPEWDPVPPDNYNFSGLVIETPHYKTVLGFLDGWAWVDTWATNAGMCGIPGGVLGKLYGGMPDTNPASFELASMDEKKPEFGWTAICGAGAGLHARLTD